MASRSKLAFILPDEFIDWLHQIGSSLGLTVVLQRGRGSRGVWDRNRDTALAATRVYLADPGTVDPKALADDSSSARLGWVVSDVPQVENNQLFAIQVAARGDWFDKDAATVRENKGALKRFDEVWRLLVPRLRSPVRAKNVITGSSADYPSIAFTEGAAAWSHRGGKLRQRGVANIEFSIPGAQAAG